MGRLRVYELAKQLKISSKELVELLAEMGIKVKNHMSTLGEDVVKQVISSLGESDDELEADAPVEETVEKKQKQRPSKGKAKRSRRGRREDTRRSRDFVSGAAATEEAASASSTDQEVQLPPSLTVQELATLLKRPGAQIVRLLFDRGVMAGLNQAIDYSVAAQVAEKLGFTATPMLEELPTIEDVQDSSDQLHERPPVVTVMGHVDHGKTSLLDAMRHTKVTAEEAGGITQHIGASVISVNGRKIVFLDTPGHEAFTSMRARGAQVTDIAILVVAADDGVMPQTVEAINHAKAANVPIIVAVNKIDKPGARPDVVKQQLTEHGLVAEEWGGDTICVPVSAKRKEGIDDILEMILLVADMQELKANPKRPAVGTIVEAELDRGRGPVATVLVQRGTLRVGDAIVAGTASGKVRAMINDKGSRVNEAGPSIPVAVLGFGEVPQAGDIVRVMPDEKVARARADAERSRLRETELQTRGGLSLDELYQRIQEGEIKELNLIVKADVQGSVEALQQALEKLSTDEVKVNAIHGGVGAITETDIMLATASNAVVVGFNVRPEGKAAKLRKRTRLIFACIELFTMQLKT
jgi:translation initiation factor IF-2